MPIDSAGGYLDLLLLAAIRATPGHGYAIMEELRRKSRGHFDLGEGSVYPVLHRLEEDGFLRSRWMTVAGRKRRVYSLTPSGRAAIGEREAQYRGFVAAMAGVLG
jgi:PadR family transcriptional regulator, regulatory protein PadR